MKSKKIFRAVAVILACAMIFQSAPAAFAAGGEPEVVALPQKYTELIMKEHDKYIEAFLNAEMGNRYFLKQIYDAKYGGKKAPTKEELKAMLFELRILNKELSASAKRYIRNIDMAKLAMAGMDEEERTLLAKALSYIFATPAYAFDFSVLDKIKSGLQSVADAADAIAEAAVSAADAFVEKAGEVMDSVVEKAGAAMDAVGEKVSAMADKVDKEVEQFKNRYFTMATVYRGGSRRPKEWGPPLCGSRHRVSCGHTGWSCSFGRAGGVNISSPGNVGGNRARSHTWHNSDGRGEFSFCRCRSR